MRRCRSDDVSIAPRSTLGKVSGNNCDGLGISPDQHARFRYEIARPGAHFVCYSVLCDMKSVEFWAFCG